MRALVRYCLAPLITAAAILSAGTPAAYLTGAAVHVADDPVCPAGTHWDHTLQVCL